MLVLQYGRHKVAHALARAANSTIEDVDRQLTALAEARETRARGKKRETLSITELAEVTCHEYPAIADPLRRLALGFHNRTFLPNLRDVQRFLDGIDPERR